VAQRPFEPLERIRIAFGSRLDTAVRQVADPSVKTFPSRRRLRKIAEADALDPTADDISASEAHETR
jgi:hypothetical protein